MAKIDSFKAFGSFDNYMAYMDERQDLIDAGELKSSWWASQDTVIDVANQSGLALEETQKMPTLEKTLMTTWLQVVRQGIQAIRKSSTLCT